MKTNAMRRVLALVLVLVTVLACSVSSASTTVINIPLTISAKNISTPTTIVCGSADNVLGTVSCSYGKITRIVATISKGSKTYQSTTWKPNTQVASFAKTINTKLKFSKLGVGTYTLKVVVTAAYGSAKSTTKTVINKRFKVVARTPVVTTNGLTSPKGTLYMGETFPLYGSLKTDVGKFTSVYATVRNEKGKAILYSCFKPNKSSFEMTYTINQKIPFELLPAGNYTYTLDAKVKYNGKVYTRHIVATEFEVVDDD